MTEKAKAELYLAYLDRILAGEKDIGPVEDDEIAELLRLAQSMIAVDLSVDIKIREALREQLLIRISPADYAILIDALKEENELTEEELGYAAAGLPGQAEENICPYCGARLTINMGRCPFCSHLD